MLSFFCAFCQILFGDCSRILHQMPKISGILYIQRGKRWGKPMPWKYLRITRRCTRDTLLPGQRGLRNTAAQYIEPPYVIFFRLFRANIPNLDVFSKIGHCIAHKGNAQEQCVDHGDDGYCRGIDIRQQNQRNQTDKQYRCTDLT